MRECVNVKTRGELTFRFPGSFTPFSLCDISVMYHAENAECAASTDWIIPLRTKNK